MTSDIKFLQAEWGAPDNVKTLISCRGGGVSQGRFASLNIGLHVGDRDEHVFLNRQRLINAANLPGEPVWLNQVHGTEIIDLSRDFQSVPTADGAITRSSGIVCAIMTADCLPLFLSNKRGDRCALLHLGWRGLADGIVEKGVLALDEQVDNIIAWAGPCIGPTRFEIGEDVRDQLGGPSSAYQASPNRGKYYANLYRLTAERLAGVGVGEFSHSDYCTYQDESLFFSHRRDQQTGRMASLIWLDE